MRVAQSLLILTFTLVLVALLLEGHQILENRRLLSTDHQAHVALCVLRQNLQLKVDKSRGFLHTHPDGFAGISAADIQSSIDDDQATLDALAKLRCR